MAERNVVAAIKESICHDASQNVYRKSEYFFYGNSVPDIMVTLVGACLHIPNLRRPFTSSIRRKVMRVTVTVYGFAISK